MIALLSSLNTIYSLTALVEIELFIFSHHFLILRSTLNWPLTDILIYCIHGSLSRNSINAIHTSYYSILLCLFIINIFILSWILLWYDYYSFLPYIFIIINYFISLCYLLLAVFMIIWLLILNRLNDFWIESFIALTIIEQITIIIGIKLMLISELMLFIACFWCLINFRLMSNAFSLFFVFPLLSSYAISIPFTNLLLLLFSSYPLNGSQIAIKSGDLAINITLLNSTLSFGLLSIVLQIKEFLYSLFSLSDCLIGSIHYFSTGLHGFHVILGSFSFFVVLFNLIFTLHCFFIEYSFALFLSSFYWHFVDFIWFLVFLLFLFFIIWIICF